MTVLRAVAAIGLVSLLTPAPAAQMRRVSVQALVTDADGRAVADLTAQDFQIASDGRSRAIESFSAAPSPATIVLLLDASASMDGTLGPGTAVPGLQSAMDAWLGARGPFADRWRIASFARQLHLGAAFGSDPATVTASARSVLAVPDEERFGPSPIWDAVDAGLDVLERETGKRALVLVTDGRSTGNRLGVRDAIFDTPWRPGFPFRSSAWRPTRPSSLTANTRLLVRPELALQLLAEQSGGSYVPALAATDPVRAPREFVASRPDHFRRSSIASSRSSISRTCWSSQAAWRTVRRIALT